MKKGVLRKTDHRGVTSDSPIISLPTIPKGKIVMFTTNKDKEIKEIKVNDKKIKVQYEDDISVEMMEERGLSISHTTIMRWVHQYGPDLDKRIRRYLKQINDS